MVCIVCVFLMLAVAFITASEIDIIKKIVGTAQNAIGLKNRMGNRIPLCKCLTEI